MSYQKLPQLLATLPKDGLHALVRPSSWPAHQFYKITRTKLKFRPRSVPSLAGSGSTTAEEGEVVKDEGLSVSGKAWGMLYRNGALQKPPSPLSKSSIPLSGAQKHNWILLSPSSLPLSTIKSLSKSESLRKEIEGARLGLIKEGRERRRGRRIAEKDAKGGVVEEAENA